VKKIIISSFLVVSVLAICLFFFSETLKKDQQNEGKEVSSANQVSQESKPSQVYENIAFSVIGDVHSDTVRLENAIKDFNEVNSGTDLMVMNGDTVDNGIPEQYTLIKNTLSSNKALLPPVLIRNIGNHEFFDYSKTSPLTAEESNVHISRYLEFSGEEKVYHDRWIKGYHFISIGSERTNTADVGSVTAYISQDQLKWLSDKLAEEFKSGRPIFVFFHQPISSTPPSQQTGWISTKQNVEVYNILAKYPEVVLFSSHTHTYLVSDNMVYLKQPFTALYTGATHGPLKTDEKGVRGYSEESQGVYAEIVNGKLTVRGRDFGKKAWVDGAEFARELN
jgi:3',5'-cyclic AMP phosphodiesterase CpdA